MDIFSIQQNSAFKTAEKMAHLPTINQDSKSQLPTQSGKMNARCVENIKSVSTCSGILAGTATAAALAVNNSPILAGGALAGSATCVGFIVGGATAGFALSSLAIAVVNVVKPYCSPSNNGQILDNRESISQNSIV